VYSFQDVAEAMVVHELLERHVPHREIREGIDVLRSQHGTEWPLARMQLAVTIARPRPRNKKPAAWLLALEQGRYVRPSKSSEQGVFDVDTFRVAEDLDRGGWIVREVPDLQHIEVDPDRLSGRPTIRGRRVSAEEVARIASEGKVGWERLVEEYDLSDAQIWDAVRWWEHVSRYEAAAA
jgi:uncharacterized protein (DUF433 family)